MAKKSAAQRIARLEGICMGAGFLLKKLKARYGSDFGIGMTEQVRQCIRECDQVYKAAQQREAAGAGVGASHQTSGSNSSSNSFDTSGGAPSHGIER